MFKAARWRSEKNKIKAVFKLQFQATQVPLSASEAATVSLVPLDVGKPTVRSERVAVVGGTCKWSNPVYETVKLTRDPKSGKINDKLYQFLVSTTGSTRAGLLGEAIVNLADYVEVFRASSVSFHLKTEAILHVTIQRMLDDVAGREVEENGDAIMRQQGRTLQSQLTKSDNEEGVKALNGRNDVNLVKDVSYISREARVKFPSSRNLPTYDDCNGKLEKSHSFDAISAASSDSSSEIYTPKENSIKNGNNQKDSTSLLSPLADIGMQPKLMTSSGDWSETLAPDRSTDGSTNSSGESGLTERLQCSDETLEKLKNEVVILTRKVEVSELELQTLRKQITKENKRGQDLLKEISSLKEERSALRRECEELKLSQKRTDFDETLSTESQLVREDPLSKLEEIKQELYHEKNLNSSLRLQLQKTQEANSELLLAVRDLDDLLEQKNRETLCHKCRKIDVEAENDEDIQGSKFRNQLPQLHQSECKQVLLETTSENDKEQHALLVNGHNNMRTEYSLEEKIADLNSEIELYNKDREELEMQMEQLALDYEILKQENHDVSHKLEQTQLREQLRMQYECSAHLSVISDLETHVQCLEKELQTQAESFESDADTLMQAKVEQEKKAIQAEQALRKTQWNNANTAERLHEELNKLSSQVSSVFYDNEKIVKQALKEASELRSQRSHLEKMLEETKENLVSLRGQYRMNLQQLLNLVNFKSKEADRLHLELKNKKEELEDYKKSGEARLKESWEKMQLLKNEIENLNMENYLMSGQKEKLAAEMENLESTNTGNQLTLQVKNSENEILKNEIALLKQKVENTLEELSDLRNMKDEKETMITMLNSKVETLGVQYNDLKQSLSEGELEKEKLRRLVSNLTGGLLKEEDMIISSEEELGNSYTNEGKPCQKSNKFAGTNDFEGDVVCLQQQRVGNKAQKNDINNKDQELATRHSGTNSEENQHIVSYICDQYTFAKMLSEMALLKRQNESMEAELKEMQERYSEISLKFAEVEGERQQLVMTIRTLKNALKN
ncbi:uncharacterized protein LOC135671739 [Musa acuminata AAA Group]|uniref:uncharacterized protein LOC135596883 n=1 Tax=Musa acuminata AAA Group TaxID=214697 RepID=UPI0031D860B8